MADFNVKPLEPTLDFANLPYWDVVIIGAGPAGLAASLTTAHRGLTTLIIEAKDQPGGQPQFLYADKQIVDIPGFPDGITGDELSERTYRQAVNALRAVPLQRGTGDDRGHARKSRKRTRSSASSPASDAYLCRKVIVACGLLALPAKLPVLDRLALARMFTTRFPGSATTKGERSRWSAAEIPPWTPRVMVLERTAQSI